MINSTTRQSLPVPPIGLALAGGAPGGAIYEIGAMRALDDALDGFSLNQCGVFVGVSAGAFLTACLANRRGRSSSVSRGNIPSFRRFSSNRR